MDTKRSLLREIALLVAYSLVLDTALGPAEALSYQLPDTGQTKCYDNYGNMIACPNPGEPFYGQDAQFPGPQPVYQDNGDGTVTDINTGLVWQQYGGNYGTYQDARYLCEGQLRNSRLGGYDDWRIPNRRELISIVDYGRSNPSINANFFPNTPSDIFWSSTLRLVFPVPPFAEFRWTVHFDSGITLYYWSDIGSDSQNYVRCVHGSPLPEGATSEFSDNGNGTVTDRITGLVWEQYDYHRITPPFYEPKNWAGALEYCENLTLAGANDWRLPNIRELGIIVSPNRYNAAIDRAYFICCGTHLGVYAYWSSTTGDQQPEKALTVDFFDGILYVASDAMKSNANIFYRCVRGRGDTNPVPTPTSTSTPRPSFYDLGGDSGQGNRTKETRSLA